jgi:RNA polymerase sigma-70 factor, ECF subfamily
LKPSSVIQFSDLSDSELIEKYSHEKDLNILSVLYQRYMVLVYGLCMKYLKNREESQDAVMQIFEVLINDVPRFEIRNFKSWLYGVSRNYCLMILRKENTERHKMEINRDFFMESTSEMHPIEKTEEEAVQEKLKTCMEQLKEDQRRCVELFYYQEFCYKQIADELNCNENQVKSHIQNGKRNLKICLESKSV